MFSEDLKDAIRQKSHAMAEEFCLYEDEGMDRDDVPGEDAILEFALDSLDPIQASEWRVACNVYGHEACLKEARKHVVTP